MKGMTLKEAKDGATGWDWKIYKEEWLGKPAYVCRVIAPVLSWGGYITITHKKQGIAVAMPFAAVQAYKALEGLETGRAGHD